MHGAQRVALVSGQRAGGVCAREAAKAVCKQRYLEFGCEGQGAKVKGIPLSVMAEKYAKGELAQQVV